MSHQLEEFVNENMPETALNGETTDSDQELFLHTALHAGQIALSNGAETARCEEIMTHILSQSEEEDYATSIVSTSLFARLGRISSLVTIKKWGINLNRVHLANEVSRNLCDKKISITEAAERLKQIEITTVYKFLLRLIAYAMLGAFLPIFVSGNIYDCITGVICGIIMALADTLFRYVNIRSFVVILIQTFLMVLCASAAAILSKGTVNINIVISAAINPMLPGLALTNSVRDMLQGNYVSGGGRLVEALVRSLSLVLGVAFGLIVGSMLPGAEGSEAASVLPPVGEDVQLLLFVAASLITAAGYCIVMEVPPKYIIAATITGALGKLLFVFLTMMECPDSISTFIATLLITILSQIFARRAKAPTILFLISGIMSLVPGSALYSSVFDFFEENHLQGLTSMTQALMIGVSIALAIFLVDTFFQVVSLAKKKQLIEK